MANTTAKQISVTVLVSQLDRAAKLAKAMDADPVTADALGADWTVQDVLNVAISRGLAALEKTYLGDQQ